MPPLPDWLLAGLFSAVATWGAMRVELRWLRRDVDRAHDRLDALPCQTGQLGRRDYDCHHDRKGGDHG